MLFLERTAGPSMPGKKALSGSALQDLMDELAAGITESQGLLQG